MKNEEKLAEVFLIKQFREKPIYEPLRKGAAPDFCIGRTAFEVRRLNQHYFHNDGRAEGLEQVSYSLNRAIYRELDKIPRSPGVGSFFWGLKFSRPLSASVRKIAKEIGKKASCHYSNGSRAKLTLAAHGVIVEFIPATNSFEKAFLLGYDADEDSGGFVGEIYLRGIQLALEDKINKTRAIAAQFDWWVLVLVDSIMPGTSWIEDVGIITLDLKHFNSIVVINPDGSLALEWPNASLKRR
jgi:hypothetical protein